MNVTRRLIEALQAIAKDAPTDADFALGGKYDYEGAGNSGDDAEIAAAKEQLWAAKIAREALAHAKEEQADHKICPPHTIYEAVGGGMICSGCEQRFVHDKDDQCKSEPVAWMRKWAYDGHEGTKGNRPEGWKLRAVTKSMLFDSDVPLYAHPAPAKGLDVERIVQVVKEWHLGWCDSAPANSTDFDVLASNLRKALEDLVENSANKLRTTHGD